jgi:hypothetical protein
VGSVSSVGVVAITFAEYVSIDGSMLHRLPDGVSLEEGALVEPLSVGMQEGQVPLWPLWVPARLAFSPCWLPALLGQARYI